MSAPADWLRVREPGVSFYVLHDRDAKALYLIDTGFCLGRRRLWQALKQRGWDGIPIRGILLTHGHLDHAFNASRFARQTGAWVAAPAEERRHLAGTYPYRGISRVCGWLEAAGRGLFRYEPPDPHAVRWFASGDRPFDHIWGGLEPVRLPGHTEGHTAYLSLRHRLLFCGDLFASHFGSSRLPPAIFNSCPQHFSATAARALALDLDGMCPAHGDDAEPAEHLHRWRKLAAKLGATPN